MRNFDLGFPFESLLQVEERTKPIVKLLMFGGALGTLLIATFWIEPLFFLRPLIVFLIFPAVGIFLLWITIVLYRYGVGRPQPALLWGGVFFIAGGAISDMLATVYVDPTLSVEANIIARYMLDSGLVSLPGVIRYAIIAQAMIILVSCLLWAAFLRHLQPLRAGIYNDKPHSSADYIKSALGSGQYTWRQMLWSNPFKMSYNLYRLLWVAVIWWVGLSLYRWYLAFSWLGFVPSHRIVPSITLLLVIILHILFLLAEYERYQAWRATQEESLA